MKMWFCLEVYEKKLKISHKKKKNTSFYLPKLKRTKICYKVCGEIK